MTVLWIIGLSRWAWNVWLPHIRIVFELDSCGLQPPLSTFVRKRAALSNTRDRSHADTMFPNPFDRKHSTIRLVLDRIFKESRNSVRRKNVLSRKDSNSSSCSNSSDEGKVLRALLRGWSSVLCLTDFVKFFWFFSLLVIATSLHEIIGGENTFWTELRRIIWSTTKITEIGLISLLNNETKISLQLIIIFFFNND